MAADRRFQQRRTREELNALLHYGHIIPVSKGWTRAFVHEHYPGWTWSGLIKVLSSAEILVNRGGAPTCCDERVEVFLFDSPDSWLVERADGSTTAAPGQV
jgi:hypothetical protein